MAGQLPGLYAGPSGPAGSFLVAWLLRAAERPPRCSRRAHHRLARADRARVMVFGGRTVLPADAVVGSEPCSLTRTASSPTCTATRTGDSGPRRRAATGTIPRP